MLYLLQIFCNHHLPFTKTSINYNLKILTEVAATQVLQCKMAVRLERVDYTCKHIHLFICSVSSVADQCFVS